MIVSGNEIGLVKDLETEAPVEELAARYMNDVDLVIVEGYKKAPLPKIEVYNYREEDFAPVRWATSVLWR